MSLEIAQEIDLKIKEEKQQEGEGGEGGETIFNIKKQTFYQILCFSLFLIILIIFLPILFVIIIPNIVQNKVDDSSLVIIEANIINPNDISFTSQVTQQFHHIDNSKGKLISQKLSLYWNDGINDKKLVSLTSSNSLNINTNTMKLNSKANVKDVDALTEFNLFAITADKFNWKVKGTAVVKTGGLKIPIDMDKTIPMKGFNGFPNTPIIDQVNVTGGTTTYLTNIIEANFTNNANIAITFGQNVSFTLKSYGIIIGTGILPNLELKTGTFPLTAIVTLTSPEPEQYNQLMKVIANFTSGYPSPVTMGPFQTSPTVTWLESGLNSMNLQTSIPGLTQKLLRGVEMYPINGKVTIPFSMNMTNPIDTVYNLTHIKAFIYSNDIMIATVDTDTKISISAKGQIKSPRLIAIANYLSSLAVAELHRLEAVGYGFLDVRSTLTGYIDEFSSKNDYMQDQVPARIYY